MHRKIILIYQIIYLKRIFSTETIDISSIKELLCCKEYVEIG